MRIKCLSRKKNTHISRTSEKWNRKTPKGNAILLIQTSWLIRSSAQNLLHMPKTSQQVRVRHPRLFSFLLNKVLLPLSFRWRCTSFRGWLRWWLFSTLKYESGRRARQNRKWRWGWVGYEQRQKHGGERAFISLTRESCRADGSTRAFVPALRTTDSKPCVNRVEKPTFHLSKFPGGEGVTAKERIIPYLTTNETN